MKVKFTILLVLYTIFMFSQNKNDTTSNELLNNDVWQLKHKFDDINVCIYENVKLKITVSIHKFSKIEIKNKDTIKYILNNFNPEYDVNKVRIEFNKKFNSYKIKYLDGENSFISYYFFRDKTFYVVMVIDKSNDDNFINDCNKNFEIDKNFFDIDNVLKLYRRK